MRACALNSESVCCPRFVTTLHRRNLLSTDDWRTFSEVFPLFDPVFVFCTCPVGGKRGVLVAEGRALLTSRVSCVPALATCGQQTTSRLRSTKIWRRFRLVSWIETCRYRALCSGQAAWHSGGDLPLFLIRSSPMPHVVARCQTRHPTRNHRLHRTSTRRIPFPWYVVHCSG